MYAAKLVLLSAFLVCFFTGSAAAHGHGREQERKQEPKTGILLVSFGTTVSEAKKAMDHIEEQTRKNFSAIPVRWAYTSSIVRHRLAENGESVPSVAQALSDMLEEGFNRIAVQSLHVIPGKEYTGLERTVAAFQDLAPQARIALGAPLMYEHKDMERVAEAVLRMAAPFTDAGKTVVLMGHGTHHAANIYYPGLQDYLQRRSADVLVGAVEGFPGLEQVIQDLRQSNASSVCLIPFMSVAGDHARNDMAGSEKDSWKSRFQAEGLDTTAVLKGLGEESGFVSIWMDHLKQALHEAAE